MAFSSVTYKPLTREGSTEEGGDVQQGLTASQEFQVAWADRYTFANDVLGYSKGVGNRAIPLQYPPSKNMFAQRVRIKGEGDVTIDPDADLPEWDWAVCTVDFGTSRTTMDVSLQDPNGVNTFGTTTEERDALVWCEQEIDYAAEWYSLPKQNCKWASGDKSGQTVDSPVRRRVAVAIMTLTFQRMPFLPTGLVQDYAGALNQGEFFGCAEGTIMFLTGKTHRTGDTSGQITQRATLQFKWREADWNKELDENGDWQMVTMKDGTSKRYQYLNFLDLINFRRTA